MPKPLVGFGGVQPAFHLADDQEIAESDKQVDLFTEVLVALDFTFGASDVRKTAGLRLMAAMIERRYSAS